MHGERISGAVACMHGRCFNLKAGFDLMFINLIVIIFLFFIFLNLFIIIIFFTFFLEHHITGGKYAQKTRTNIFRYLLMMYWLYQS